MVAIRQNFYLFTVLKNPKAYRALSLARIRRRRPVQYYGQVANGIEIQTLRRGRPSLPRRRVSKKSRAGTEGREPADPPGVQVNKSYEKDHAEENHSEEEGAATDLKVAVVEI